MKTNIDQPYHYSGPQKRINLQCDKIPRTLTPPKRYKFSRECTGIACCRLSNTKRVMGVNTTINKQLELLVVRKLHTYAFAVFVLGRYASNDTEAQIKLFNRMEIDEKRELLSLDFSIFWYHIWSSNNRPSSYFSAKNKFDLLFVADGGIKLRALLAKSNSHGTRKWEIPKGRKRDKTESDIQCAIREFGEETKIMPGSYKLFPSAWKTEKYIDDDIQYINKYYFAYTKHATPTIDFNDPHQIQEVSGAVFMTLDELRKVDPRLAVFAKPIFQYVKNQIKPSSKLNIK
jgi:8-oxo-dGTP pyrophosphatase MutT (NUDIX family)